MATAHRRIFCRPVLRWAFAAAVTFALFLGGPDARGDEELEFAVKATYLYKFAPFVTWPAPLAPGPGRPLNLCLSGTDRVTQLAQRAAAGQTVNGGAINVVVLTNGDPPANCHILYVANSPFSAKTLDAAHGKPILTVTDGSFPDRGIVQLVVVDHHVRFDIDEQLAADAGISISSKLLELAHSVSAQTRAATP